jgi:hypothetical protein
MFTIRATRKLLTRIAVKGKVERRAPTTVLGDWYANLLHLGSRQLILCTSERSLLSVVMPARGAKASLLEQLQGGVGQALAALAIPASTVERELAEMQEAQVAGTESRSVLGSMNDFAFMMEVRLRTEPDTPMAEWSRWLAQTPCRPLGYDRPVDVVKRLLAEGPSNNGMKLTKPGYL